MPVDSKTLRVQAQAEEVYDRTDYDRAFFIYRKELVPIGDKYGQYMVGFMYLTGKSVDEDPIAASAWYRLAAERDTEEFLRVRDQLMAKLDANERAESDRQFIELRRQYGDVAILTREIRKDYELLTSRTGTRLPTGSSTLLIMEGQGTRSGSDYYGQIERRMLARLEYIAKHTEIEIIDIDIDNVDLNSIEDQVAVYLRRLD